MLSGFFLGGIPDAGWTAYAPLSITSAGIGMDTWVLGVQVLGFSSIFRCP